VSRSSAVASISRARAIGSGESRPTVEIGAVGGRRTSRGARFLLGPDSGTARGTPVLGEPTKVTIGRGTGSLATPGRARGELRNGGSGTVSDLSRRAASAIAAIGSIGSTQSTGSAGAASVWFCVAARLGSMPISVCVRVRRSSPTAAIRWVSRGSGVSDGTRSVWSAAAGVGCGTAPASTITERARPTGEIAVSTSSARASVVNRAGGSRL